MSTPAQILFPPSSGPVCKRLVKDDYPLPDDAASQAPETLISALLEGDLSRSALAFIGYALPKRSAIWWGWVCVVDAAGESLSAADRGTLEAVRRWVLEPSDEARRLVKDAADANGLESPAGVLALGVFFSGGSLAPADLPPVPPDEHLTARMVANAVQLAAVLSEPEKAPQRHKRMAGFGVEVAHRRLSWHKR